jgi:hypothetical protein
MKVPNGWQMTAFLQLFTTAHGRTLVCQVQQANKGWALLAFETSEDVEGVESVFEDHKHASLGLESSFDNAIRKATRFAEKWKTKRNVIDELICECTEIEQ